MKLFDMLTLPEKEELLKELRKPTDLERKEPKKTKLEEAWHDIQRNIKKVNFYDYIDDQLEITLIWDICEDLIKPSRLLSSDSGSAKETRPRFSYICSGMHRRPETR
ncbi:hypothetical protein [Hominibacterium faecale]|uniref:hypothetical protein n=1 Tax=Hominibacterium faecale TaxID=2839743 RepID=UPI0022B2A4C4|nr:hypothetical protein [Hominibacterium faecale]